MKAFFTEEIKNFITENVYGKSSRELANLVNEKFGTHYTAQQIKDYKGRNRLKGGYKFKREARLQPNAAPVGTERFRGGYVEVKIQQPSVWVLKHKVIWEEANGPIPDNHCLIFLNCDKKDVRLENLMLVSRNELRHINKKRAVVKDADLTKIGILGTRLMLEVSKNVPEKYSDNPKIDKADALYNSGKSIDEIAQKLNLAHRTVENYLQIAKRKKEYTKRHGK